MKPYLAIILTFVAYAANTQAYTPFYITNPVQGTILTANTNATISWLNGTSNTAKIYVLEGEKANAMQLTGISFDIDGSKGSFVWKVPTQLPPNNTYTLMVAYPTSPNTNETSYSSQFRIIQLNSSSATKSFSSLAGTTLLPSSSSSLSVYTQITANATSISQHISSSLKVSTKPTATQIASTTPVPFTNSVSKHFLSDCLIALVLASSLYLV
ncbi:hypothetical protein BY458DRAFT_259549 [Sporodiniella umbellata]|nr:hypothetical protein BY458DRAFT_259549 [Sporodiniella umbellata]